MYVIYIINFEIVTPADFQCDMRLSTDKKRLLWFKGGNQISIVDI